MPCLTGRSIVRRRTLALALVLGLALGAPAARAWEYPLLPHVQGLAFFPETPSTDTHVFAQLSAVYPGECWRLVDTLLVDSASVRVTVRRATDCVDSVSTWNHYFDLGFLAAGMHELTVHCTVLEDGQPPVEEEITVPFEVVQAAPPPPPPPPGGVLPLLEQIAVTGAEPGHPVTLTLSGFTPFECTLIHGERVVDQQNVEASFEWQATCTDTSRRWQRSFALGVYPIGYHEVTIKFDVIKLDSTYSVYNRATFNVRDPNEPPPVDSVTILVTGITIEPSSPTTSDVVKLHVLGSYPPYFCGRIVQDGRWDHTLELVMEPVRDCTDTVRTFRHTIHLGLLPAGYHPFQLTTIWQLWGTAGYRYWPIAFNVTDSAGPPPPPPPPPPDDSVTAGLSPGKPNPFRDASEFSVSLDEARMVELSVFDVLGRRVTTIHHGMLPAGSTRLRWDGRRPDGTRAPGGIYFYNLVMPDRVVRRRVVLLGSP